ncbi:MAG TPA: sulfatase-like hydrolase/transferase, partial [Polyangiaceae bacterium]
TSSDSHWNEVDGPPTLARYGLAGGTYPSPNGAPGQGWRVDPHIAGQFEDWLTQEATDEPWCTTVSFVNPHDIAWWWRWSDRFAEEAVARRIVGGLPANFETPAQLEARGKPRVQRSLQDTSANSFGVVPYESPGFASAWMPFLDLYVKLQLAVDTQVQRVLDALASRPQVLANTVVVFTSDHGEYGASHGLRGKGAGAYEEAIRVPLIIADHTGTFGLVPGVRDQISSSVDVAPLLLTLASQGTGAWRQSPEYEHLATRPDLLAMARDPAHPGRRFALHATDEVLTEYALLPYAADAPLHITAMVTPTHKYAAYSHWKAGTMTPVPETEEHELYDYSTRGGQLEIANQTGAHPQEEALHAQLRAAV